MYPFKILSKKVADLVRHLQVIEPRIDPTELPEVDAGQQTKTWITAESEASTGGRSDWLSADSKTIDSFFGHLDKPPLKTDMILAFEGLTELRDILTRKSMQQCRDKIKNTIRANQRRARAGTTKTV